MYSVIYCLICRSLSSSELDMLKDEFLLGKFEGCSTPTSMSTVQTDPSAVKLYRSITCSGPGDLQEMNQNQTTILPDIHYGSVTERQQSIMKNIHNEQGISVKFPNPPPSFLLPRCKTTTKSKETISTSQGNVQQVTTIIQTSETNVRRSIPKSISIDTSLLNTSFPSPDSVTAFSAGATPTENFNTLSSIPLIQSSSCDTSTFAPSPQSDSTEHLTPRTARKQFFESQLSDSTSGYMSWPERGSSRENVKHVKQTSLPDPNAIMEAVERAQYKSTEPTTTSNESISQSELNTTQESTTSNEEKDVHSGIASSSSTDSVSGAASKPAKPKRKLFKRSSSADSSTVRSYLARAGVRALSAGAPSTLSPSEFFAAVKNKFRHSKKSSSSGSGSDKEQSKSDPHLQIPEQHEEPTASTSSESIKDPPPVTPMKNTFVPPPTPPISEMRRRLLPEVNYIYLFC